MDTWGFGDSDGTTIELVLRTTRHRPDTGWQPSSIPRRERRDEETQMSEEGNMERNGVPSAGIFWDAHEVNGTK